MIKGVVTILWKDLLVEWRSRERLGPMVVFVFLIILVFNFSFALGGSALHEIGAGVLWSAFVFAGLFGLNHTFAAELDNNCLDALMLAPVSHSSLYLAKMLGNLLFLLVVELLSLPFFSLFFNLSPGLYLVPLVAVLTLGASCLASVGTLFAAMSSNSRLREFLLPLLVLPMIYPALIWAVKATAIVFEHSRPSATGALATAAFWPGSLTEPVSFLLVYSIVFTTLALMLFDQVLED